MSNQNRTRELNQLAVESLETMRAAVKKTQAESLALGVPITYTINGVRHWKLPSGEVTRENPWKNQDSTEN